MKIRKAAVSVRPRTMIGASACAIASAFAMSGGVTSAQAATTCTWGGTPANPTGTIEFLRQGLTNTPSPFALPFRAAGVVEGGGPCHGQTVTFEGQFDAGSSCAAATSQGLITGFPDVLVDKGVGIANTVAARLYDRNGNLVGSYQVIAQGPKNDPLFTACNTPQGAKTGFFSATLELSGTQNSRHSHSARHRRRGSGRP
jgi:hypothetical protein